MRIAFYAPLKAPDHPVPSGDRQMGRLLIQALRQAGHEVDLVSRFRSFLPVPDPPRQSALSAEAAHEAERLALVLRSPPEERPDLWFTYHNHYKAPDLLGPAVARRLGLPYVLTEASDAPKRAAQWGVWHEAARVAIRTADVNLCFTDRDRDGLAKLPNFSTPLLDLPPFIDAKLWPEAPTRNDTGPVRIVSVAMMRAGDKLASYRLLAAALARCADRDWVLTVVGDGPLRAEVQGAFADLPASRIEWRGALPSEAVRLTLAEADVYAWPGFGEAFGLGYLEAQAMALPVVALDTAGVASVVRHGHDGLLVGDPTPTAYAEALARLLDDPVLRTALGRAGAAHTRSVRTVENASRIVHAALLLATDRARQRVPASWQEDR